MRESFVNTKFVYTMDNRIVWLSEHVFQVSVLDDLYRVYQIEDLDLNVRLNNCFDFFVKDFLAVVYINLAIDLSLY